MKAREQCAVLAKATVRGHGASETDAVEDEAIQ
jgi:hypothetical protein